MKPAMIYLFFLNLELCIAFDDRHPYEIIGNGSKLRVNIWSDSEMEEVTTCLMLKACLFVLV